MPAKTIMVQGTASSVGKSILVTALCRIFRQDGFKVAPFKSQNMALNSFVTKEGGEIGRAQAEQAEAAGIEPSVNMNPVLLKPEADSRSQVIVLGKVTQTLKASQYYDYTPYLLEVIQNSLNKLRSTYDIVVIEGAGSPAEINLKDKEIANMRIARMANSPVLLVGDIDRGGVFASMVGTLELLEEDERRLVTGLIINKFRGDISLLKPGLEMLEQRTGKPVLGVIPYFRNLQIAQEDSVFLEERARDAAGPGLEIDVIRLPHISNYDDFDPFEHNGCILRFIETAKEIEHPDLVIIPGTKNTIDDLLFIREKGLDKIILKQAEKGIPVIGVCGGFQMLGKIIQDPYHVESQETGVPGLGLLNIETTFSQVKTTTQIKAKVISNFGLLEGMAEMEVTGYEIHMGQTDNLHLPPVFQVLETPQGTASYPDGAISDNGLVFGTYFHGIFHNAGFTQALISRLGRNRGLLPVKTGFLDKNRQYDELAQIVRQNLDIPAVYKMLQ